MVEASRKSVAWSQRLVTALRAIETIAGPAAGDNHDLKRVAARLRDVIERLGPLSEDRFFTELGAIGQRTSTTGRERARSLAYSDASLDEVEKSLSDETTSKETLLKILQERFGASRGTLARLSKPRLAERLAELVMNERGHQTISRVASGSEAD